MKVIKWRIVHVIRNKVTVEFWSKKDRSDMIKTNVPIDTDEKPLRDAISREIFTDHFRLEMENG